MSTCSNCLGKCCKVGGIFITKEEYKNIPNANTYKDIISIGESYVVKDGCVCPFLNDNGCTLGENKFMDCKIYPYIMKSMHSLVIDDSCPYHKFFDNKQDEIAAYTVFIEAKSKKVFTEKDFNNYWKIDFPKNL